jgi:septum formation protein
MLPTDVKYLLASRSPRRKDLLHKMGISFEIIDHQHDEKYPEHLSDADIVSYLSEQKALSVFSSIKPTEVLISADTIVWQKGRELGKPKSIDDAKRMLRRLSGSMHRVFTGVTIMNSDFYHTFTSETEIWFHSISEEEIDYYVKNFSVLDKAGAYGIQDWIGKVKVAKMVGSYTNVVGLPTAELYHELKRFLAQAR